MNQGFLEGVHSPCFWTDTPQPTSLGMGKKQAQVEVSHALHTDKLPILTAAAVERVQGHRHWDILPPRRVNRDTSFKNPTGISWLVGRGGAQILGPMSLQECARDRPGGLRAAPCKPERRSTMHAPVHRSPTRQD